MSFFRRHAPLLRRILPGAAMAVLLPVAAFVTIRALGGMDWRDVRAHVLGLGTAELCAAVGFTVLAYICLIGYDLSALRYVGIKLKLATVAFAGFAGYAVSNSVGFMLLSGGAVRYRLYSAAGIGGGDVARVVLFSTTTFSFGITAVGAAALLTQPQLLAPWLHADAEIVRLLAGIATFGLAAAVAFASLKRQPIRMWRWSLEVPTPGLVVAQIVIASAEILFSAGVLYVLLPSGLIDYPAFVAIYAAALLAGVLSHVPGGLGVFDSFILLSLAGGGATAPIVGALLLYRAFYFAGPLLLAVVALAIYEAWAQRAMAGRLLRRVFRRRARQGAGE